MLNKIALLFSLLTLMACSRSKEKIQTTRIDATELSKMRWVINDTMLPFILIDGQIQSVNDGSLPPMSGTTSGYLRHTTIEAEKSTHLESVQHDTTTTQKRNNNTDRDFLRASFISFMIGFIVMVVLGLLVVIFIRLVYSEL